MSIYLGSTKISGSYNISKNIGEVYFSESSSAADNIGGLPLFTGETISNADQLYPQFYNWILNHPELQIYQTDYESSMSNYGQCAKYVINTTTKSIRLAKIIYSDRYLIKSYKNGNSWYRIYNDGWCEQGDFRPAINKDTTATVNLLIPFIDTNYEVLNISIANNVTGDARSNTMLQSSKTEDSFILVQDTYTDEGGLWQANGLVDISNYIIPIKYPWVFAYNAAIPASTVQASEFQAALSGRADINLSNISSTAATNLDFNGIRTVVETYQNGSSWYRIWSDGWCEQGGVFTGDFATNYQFMLLKPYRDINYTVITNAIQYNTMNAACYSANTKTTTYFSGEAFRGGSGGIRVGTLQWEAKGYIR